MQTILWRLWKFWEMVGFWWCFQKIWHSSPVHGWFKFFSFQVHSSEVSNWLSLAGQTPNLNTDQKSNFFLPNLGLWPVNLRTYLVTSPLQMHNRCWQTPFSGTPSMNQHTQGSICSDEAHPSKGHLYVVEVTTGIVSGFANAVILTGVESVCPQFVLGHTAHALFPKYSA